MNRKEELIKKISQIQEKCFNEKNIRIMRILEKDENLLKAELKGIEETEKEYKESPLIISIVKDTKKIERLEFANFLEGLSIDGVNNVISKKDFGYRGVKELLNKIKDKIKELRGEKQ